MSYVEIPPRIESVDQNGKRTTTINYIGTEEAPDPGLGTLKNKSVTRDVAGQIRSSYTFESNSEAGDPNAETSGVAVEIVSSLRSVPIEAHPNFAEPFLQPRDVKFIKDKLNTIVSNNDIIDFSATRDAERAASLFGYLAKGITSYYEPSLIVRKTYQAASPPPAKSVGKIASPGVSVPGEPRGANFLLVNLSSRGSAGSFTVTEEYEMSGEGGWDTFLYGS